jgi:hypothetical protein
MGVFLSLVSLRYWAGESHWLWITAYRLPHLIHIDALRYRVDWVPNLLHDHVYLYTAPLQCTWQPVG